MTNTMGGRAVISISESKAGFVTVMAVLRLDRLRILGHKNKEAALCWRGLSEISAEALVLVQLLIPDTAARIAVAVATAADGAGGGRFANHAAAIQPFG